MLKRKLTYRLLENDNKVSAYSVFLSNLDYKSVLQDNDVC